MKKCIVTLAALFLFAGLCRAQDGLADASFGMNGIVQADSVGLLYPYIFTAQQKENKIVVATTYQAYKGAFRDARGFIVKCFLSDGSPDTAFKSDCRFKTGDGTYGEFLLGMVVLSTGRIILSGTQTIVGLLPDGSIDYSFGDSGKIADPGFIVNSMALQSGDRIVLAGHSGSGDVYTSRLFLNGKRDSSYGVNGIASYQIPGASLYAALAIHITSTDKIIIGGNTFKSPGPILLQFTANGAPDPVFGNKCYQQFTVNGTDAGINAIALQADGKICVAGNLSWSAYLARLNSDGTFDRSVNGTGILFNDTIWAPNQSGSAAFINSTVNIQKDGRILYAFNSSNSSRDSFRIALRRFRPDGSIDQAFGTNGSVVTPLCDLDVPGPILIQPDSKILLAAASGYEYHSTHSPTLGSIYLVRYLTSLHMGVLSFQQGVYSTDVYPNPIEQSAIITYTLPSDEVISIDLLDITGRAVQHFISKEKRDKGAHSEKLSFSNALRAGTYIVVVSNQTGRQCLRVTKQ